jgi:hypothetical protein
LDGADRSHSSLTVGSAVGSIREIFAKIKAIDVKHGKFDFVLCAGDFFGPLKEDINESGGEDDISQLLGGNIKGSSSQFIHGG